MKMPKWHPWIREDGKRHKCQIINIWFWKKYQQSGIPEQEERWPRDKGQIMQLRQLKEMPTKWHPWTCSWFSYRSLQSRCRPPRRRRRGRRGRGGQSLTSFFFQNSFLTQGHSGEGEGGPFIGTRSRKSEGKAGLPEYAIFLNVRMFSSNESFAMSEVIAPFSTLEGMHFWDACWQLCSCLLKSPSLSLLGSPCLLHLICLKGCMCKQKQTSTV